MKKLIMLLAFLSNTICIQAQLYISPGALLVQNGTGTITLSNIDFINSGTFTAGTGNVLFTGNINSALSGTSLTTFNSIEVAKTSSSKIILQSNINVNNAVLFTSGLIDLNTKNIDLGTTGFLQNENENSRVVGANGGYIQRMQNLNSPVAINSGNLGAVLTSAANLGSVLIKRGHKVQTGVGINSSISRWFDITPNNNASLNATLKFNYFNAELNNLTECETELFKSTDNAINWVKQTATVKDTIANYIVKNGINNFALYTIAKSDTIVPILNIKLFIQGYYTGSSQMAPVLMNQGMGSSSTNTDTIVVELHNCTFPYNLVATNTVLLHTDGSALCTFISSLTGSYFIVIKHRNVVETWSALPIQFSSLSFNYDFTTAANKAYGNNQKQVAPGVFALYNGDINQDENVDLLDASILETDINAFQFGYFATDINGDGNVDLLDAPLMEENINGFVFSNHP